MRTNPLPYSVSFAMFFAFFARKLHQLLDGDVLRACGDSP
jgi:hypothetical protein